jgi:ribulose-phosphate 3-epimerase
LREIIASNGYRARIEVDGGIGPGNLRDVISVGAEVVVAGSAIFGAPDIIEAVRGLRQIAESYNRVLETT